MEPTPEGGEPGAEFILPMRDVVHPETWHEWEERGFQWYRNYALGEGETALTASGKALLRSIEDHAGKENVATGDPFDQEAGQPVRRTDQLGIYWRPPENR
jgi:hypothetical protein